MANSLRGFGPLYWLTGPYEQSAHFLQQDLVFSVPPYGPEDPLVAEALNDLAETYNSHGKYGEAEALHSRALAIREQVQGPDHPDTAVSLKNLAALDRHQGRYREVNPFIKEI